MSGCCRTGFVFMFLAIKELHFEGVVDKCFIRAPSLWCLLSRPPAHGENSRSVFLHHLDDNLESKPSGLPLETGP